MNWAMSWSGRKSVKQSPGLFTSTEGPLVHDDSVVNVLRITKETTRDVQVKLTIASETETCINAEREKFRPGLYFYIVGELFLIQNECVAVRILLAFSSCQ